MSGNVWGKWKRKSQPKAAGKNSKVAGAEGRRRKGGNT